MGNNCKKCCNWKSKSDKELHGYVVKLNNRDIKLLSKIYGYSVNRDLKDNLYNLVKFSYLGFMYILRIFVTLMRRKN